MAVHDQREQRPAPGSSPGQALSEHASRAARGAAQAQWCAHGGKVAVPAARSSGNALERRQLLNQNSLYRPGTGSADGHLCEVRAVKRPAHEQGQAGAGLAGAPWVQVAPHMSPPSRRRPRSQVPAVSQRLCVPAVVEAHDARPVADGRRSIPASEVVVGRKAVPVCESCLLLQQHRTRLRLQLRCAGSCAKGDATCGLAIRYSGGSSGAVPARRRRWRNGGSAAWPG